MNQILVEISLPQTPLREPGAQTETVNPSQVQLRLRPPSESLADAPATSRRMRKRKSNIVTVSRIARPAHLHMKTVLFLYLMLHLPGLPRLCAVFLVDFFIFFGGGWGGWRTFAAPRVRLPFGQTTFLCQANCCLQFLQLVCHQHLTRGYARPLLLLNGSLL